MGSNNPLMESLSGAIFGGSEEKVDDNNIVVDFEAHHG